MSHKYESIAKIIEEDIISSSLGPGSKLPSIRAICDKFHCSFSTAIKAYAALENKNIVYSIPNSGYYLMEGQSHVRTANNRTILDFASGNMDIQVLPISEFRDCVDRAIEIYKEKLFLYANPLGNQSVRETLAGFFTDYQIFTRPDNIVITSGSQQALDILARMPFPNNKDKVLLEQPTYFCMMNILKLNNIKAAGIERNKDGIDFNLLERIFKEESIKFFYTMPRFQHPAGYSYSTSQKKTILKLAERYNVYIIEDDHLADLELNSRNDPMKAYDGADRVVYLRSFSKTLFPGLRMGAVILPTELISVFHRYKFNIDVYSSLLSQGALEVYLQSGMHHSHMKKIRVHYRRRMNFLKQKWKELKIESINAYIPDTGFYAWLDLPEKISGEVFKKRLLEHGVIVDSGDRYYLEASRRLNNIKLCISNVNNHEIEKGLNIIKEEIVYLEGKYR